MTFTRIARSGLWALCVCGGLAGVAGAGLVNPQVVSLGSLVNVTATNNQTFWAAQSNGQSIYFGDKLFSDFEWRSIAQGGALAVDPNAVLITYGIDDVSGDYVLDFALGLGAKAGQTSDVLLTFKVSILEPQFLNNAESDFTSPTDYVEYFLEDVGLRMVGSVAVENGFASVGEDVSLYHPTVVDDNPVLAELDVAEVGGSFDSSAHAFFEPVKSIWVRKDIFVTGGVSGQQDDPLAAAKISNVIQTFSQVPEPASAVLVVLGLALAGRRRPATGRAAQTRR